MSALCKCGADVRPNQRTCKVCHAAQERRHRLQDKDKIRHMKKLLIGYAAGHYTQVRERNRALLTKCNCGACQWVDIQWPGEIAGFLRNGKR
jgi:hypothetical protein